MFFLLLFYFYFLDLDLLNLIFFSSKLIEGKWKQIRMVIERVVMKKESVDELSDDNAYMQNKVEFIRDDFFFCEKQEKNNGGYYWWWRWL